MRVLCITTYPTQGFFVALCTPEFKGTVNNKVCY